MDILTPFTRYLILILTEKDQNITFDGPSQNICTNSRPRDAVRLIVLFLGANDACAITARQAHAPLETYRKNLVSIVHFCQQHCPYADFIMVTPPPIIRHESRLEDDQIERSGYEAVEHTLELSG